MNYPLDQLYKTKLQLAAVLAAVVGIGLLVLGRAVEALPTLSWLVGWPASELGAVLVGIGVFSVINDYYTRREADARTSQLLRRAIQHEAPAIRDAVLDSFAFNAEALKGIASDDTLDRIASNAIGLRVGDAKLAQAAYADLREQVIRSPERWRDVDVSVSLSPWTDGPAGDGDAMLVATIRWEYKVKPANAVMRFACVSQQAEYRELLRDPTVAGPWYFGSTSPVDPASTDAFELVSFTLDGKARPIRRTARTGAQVYSVSLGKAATTDVEATLAYTYRVLLQRHGHLLYLDLPRPAKGIHVRLDYANAGIRRVNVLDYFAGPDLARVEHSSEDAPAKTVDVSFDGQVFPRAGVAFVWVLSDETSERTID